MSGLIDASPKKLDEFYVYIDDFQKDILLACDNLISATNELKRRNSREDIQEADRTVEKVQEIIESERETFNTLKATVATYSQKLKKLKRIMR